MKRLLELTAILESVTGIALIAMPAWLSSILLGSTLDTAAGLALARIAGIALISLGLACWLGSGEHSRASLGIVAAMLFYNLGVALLLLSLRYGAGMTGIGLLPVSALHAALAAWCIACLRTARPPKSN